MSTPMPPNMPQAQPTVKKTSPWVWILGGLAIFFFAICVTCGFVAYMGYRAVKHVGFDADLMKRNPGLAMAKMASAANPDVETVSTNDSAGTITVRDKKSGKMTTLKFDPDKKQMVVIGDDGKQGSITATSDGLTMASSDGSSVKLGTAASNAPSWVPVYPGSSPKGTMSSTTPEGSQNTFTFSASDAPSKILTYYQDQLKSAGFTINMTTNTEQGGILQASDDSKKRTITVTSSVSSSGSDSSVNSSEKK